MKLENTFRSAGAANSFARRQGRGMIPRGGTAVGIVLLSALVCFCNGGLLSVRGAEPTMPEAVETTGAASNASNGAITNESATSPATNEISQNQESDHGIHHDVLFSLGHDVELKAGETAQAIIVIGGSAHVHGNVDEAVVTIFGDSQIDADVRDVVAIMGDVSAGSRARIEDTTVTVGGKQTVVPGAVLGRNPTEIDFPNWLKGWVRHCALLARPLSLHVPFVWMIALLFFLLYVLIAVLFPRPVQACVTELTVRPATTVLIGILSLILLPLAFIILAATGLGLIAMPFLLAGLFFVSLLGRVALLEWLGLRLVGQFASNLTIKPLLALILGAALIAILYLVPIIGLLTFAVISVWGLGGAVLAGFSGLRRELPEKAVASPTGSTMPVQLPQDQSGLADLPGNPGSAAVPGETATATLPGRPPVLPEVLSYPKAGFWERMGAGFLDMVLIGIASGFVGPFGVLVAVAYFAGLWTWRGTSIGGIVLGLKVVRLDGQPVTLPVALVRALSSVFSVIVLFLGFIWIAWDRDKQAWHDKIAGTVVLKLPRGTPLLTL